MKSSDSSSFLEGIRKLSKENPRLLVRVKRLVSETIRAPRSGIGMPEKLDGFRPRVVWSRRINQKHRLIYEITEDAIIFLRCYGHYDDH